MKEVETLWTFETRGYFSGEIMASNAIDNKKKKKNRKIMYNI